MQQFGSNVAPRRFGVGADKWDNWTCVCGTTNRKYLVRCLMCNISRDLAKEANETEK